MYQIINYIYQHPEDPTRVTLIYANSTIADMLLFKELQEFNQDNRIQVYHTISRPEDPNWEGTIILFSYNQNYV